jgi:hypothetical protein
LLCDLLLVFFLFYGAPIWFVVFFFLMSILCCVLVSCSLLLPILCPSILYLHSFFAFCFLCFHIWVFFIRFFIFTCVMGFCGLHWLFISCIMSQVSNFYLVHYVWNNLYDALPSHGVKPTWGFHKVKLRKVETWRHAPSFQL